MSTTIGSTAGGTQVTLTGAGLSEDEDAVQVYLGNSMAEIQNVSTSKIVLLTLMSEGS